MNRKFLHLFFTLCFSIAFSQSDKPNIIWLVCEDQSVDFFPMYGDQTVDLPNLESLADDSIIYDNMHATTPVCAPARSAIITGMYPTTLGTHNMRTYNEGRDTNQPSLGIPSYSPKFPNYILPFTKYLRDQGYYCTNNNKQDYNFKISNQAWDQTCRYCSGKQKENIHWRNRGKDQPFFAVFNFQITHEAQIWSQAKSKIYIDSSKIKVPPYFPDNPIIRRDMAINYSNLIRMDKEVGKLIQELKNKGLYENSYIFFYSDHGGPFPRHKRAIYESGTKVPFMIKLPNSKQAGTRDDRLLSFVDLAPTILDIAGLDVPEYIQGKSILDKKIEERKYLISASDRFDEHVDRIRSIQSKKYKLIVNFDTSKPHALPVSYREKMPMMRKMNEMYFSGELDSIQQLWFQTPKKELEFYDLQADPYEINNLIETPVHNYKSLVNRFRKALEKWIYQTNDLGRISEKEIVKYSVQ